MTCPFAVIRQLRREQRQQAIRLRKKEKYTGLPFDAKLNMLAISDLFLEELLVTGQITKFKPKGKVGVNET